jgi:hypothetical protein
MSNRDGPHSHIVEALDGAVGVGGWSLAAEFVEAIAQGVAGVAVGLRESSGVEMRTPLAVLVNPAAVSELGPAKRVQLRQTFEREIVEDRGEEVVRVGRAARDIDDWSVGH